MEKAAKQMLARHRETDMTPVDERQAQREACKLERLQKEAKQLKDWLAANPEDRKGPKGGVRQSNLTDNESAKMATGKGVIQGYTGVAAVDEKHQIILDAQAHGTGSEQELLVPVVQAVKPQMSNQTVVTADAGYHSENNIKMLATEGINAYLPDNGYRKRDERYHGQAAHKAKPDPLWDKRGQPLISKRFGPGDFQLAEDGSHCLCPAGKRLYSNGSNCTFNGYAAMKFRGAERDCLPCPLRTQCLRTPEKTKTRQVAFFQGKRDGYETHTDRMKRKIDSDQGRQMITRRFATVEPVFGSLRNNKRLDRFTLRGRSKVDGQWKLYCLVHNIEKLAHYGVSQ